MSHKSKLPDVRQAQSFPGYVRQSPYSNFIPTLVYTGQLWYIQVNSGIYRSTLVYTGQLWYIQVNSGIYRSTLVYTGQLASIPTLSFSPTVISNFLLSKDQLHQTNCIRQTASDKLHQTNCIRQNIPTYSAKKETNRSFKNCKVPCHLSLYN